MKKINNKLINKKLDILNEAFTLVELLGVIIVLAVIALITFPIIDNSIQKSRQSALERTIENIERAAYSYSVEYDLGYSTEQQVLKLSELISKGFISKEEHINPVTDEELKGCVLYNWDETKKQYKFEYADPCEVTATFPTMTLVYDNNYINGNGWINRNIMVSLNGTGSKFYYCLSDSECDPIIEENKPNGTKILTNEGTNVICAKAVNSHGESDVVCTEELKIDKTPPTIGSITVNGTKGSNDWYTTDVSINVTNGSDALSGHDRTVSSVTEINRNTLGTMVYVVTTDLAGNSATEAFNIKVDKDYPTLIAKSGDVTITQGDSNPTSNYFTYNYSISGGSINCDPSNTNSLGAGTKTITCTATGGNGKKVSATKQIKVINDDISLAFEYIGNQAKPDKLPGKGEGYYVQSVSCQNGTAKWSNELWALTNVKSENKQIMSCKLTLGDDKTYDDTIDQSFENLKPENIVSGVEIGDITGNASGGTFLIARGPKLTDVGLGGQYATQVIAKSNDVVQNGNSYTLPPGEYTMILEGRVNGRAWEDKAYSFAIQCSINSSFVVNYSGEAPSYSPRTTRKEYNFTLDAPGTISAFVKQDSNMVSYQDSYVMIAVVKTG